jgi:competence protein ComEA
MERTFREALSRAAACVMGSRFAKPIARVALAAAGLVLLAIIGRTAVAGAIGSSAAAGAAPASIGTSAPATPSAESSPGLDHAAARAADGASSAVTTFANPTPIRVLPTSRAPASSDDPVVLNAATEADLRRLPGIGAKRADAILSLRARLGRFRAMEDLLKVKGIGRATLKRLRPLLRLDEAPSDAGAPRPATSAR